MRNGSGAISVIAQIAIGNGDLYTRTRAWDNIMVSLKIALPFHGRIVIGKSSGATVLWELSLIFIARRLISAFIVMMDFVEIFIFLDMAELLFKLKKFAVKERERNVFNLLPICN